MNIAKEVSRILPLLQEAAKYNKRPLMLDLTGPIIRALDIKISETKNPDLLKSLRGIKRHLKAFLTKSAWEKKINERAEEGLSLPVGEKNTEDMCNNEGMEDAIDLHGERGIMERGRGVVQANTKGTGSRSMRDVISTADHFENDFDIPSESSVGLENFGDTVLDSPRAFPSRGPRVFTGRKGPTGCVL